MIVGLNGRMQSGKDTVAQLLIEKFENVERLAFADKLKDSACALFGISRDELERLKVHDDIVFVPWARHDVEADPYSFEYEPLNMRQILQRYGTEAHRDIFGSEFWIAQALDYLGDHTRKLIVVTDMRFPNEMAAVKARGGITVKVTREQVDSTPITHPSEQYIPNENFDYILSNDVDLYNLELHIGAFVSWLLSRTGIYLKERSHASNV